MLKVLVGLMLAVALLGTACGGETGTGGTAGTGTSLEEQLQDLEETATTPEEEAAADAAGAYAEAGWQRMRVEFVINCHDSGAPLEACECFADGLETYPYLERPKIAENMADPRNRKERLACGWPR
jgi:hypothetical protein